MVPMGQSVSVPHEDEENNNSNMSATAMSDGELFF